MTGFDSKRKASRDLLEPQAEPAANEWREAVDNELVCLHIGTADSFPTAQAALFALIYWHVTTALDPEVSSSAQALINRGRAVAEPLTDGELRDCFISTNTAEPLSEGWPGLERFARAVEQAHGINGSAA